MLEGLNFHIALREVEKAHNAAHHTVTGLIPEEVMFGRKIRGSLPLLEPMIVNLDDDAIRIKDWQAKLKAKEHENEKRGAKEPNSKLETWW